MQLFSSNVCVTATNGQKPQIPVPRKFNKYEDDECIAAAPATEEIYKALLPALSHCLLGLNWQNIVDNTKRTRDRQMKIV